jgi:hypothetical protein
MTGPSRFIPVRGSSGEIEALGFGMALVVGDDVP